jgi:putative tryptophan/tyrosine transport system substrate-binding protein
MRRREFIVSSLVLVSWPEVAAAQSPTRPVRIGWIVQNSAFASAPFLDALRAGLTDLGYHESRNLTIETRYADDVPERVPGLIEELLRIPVDVMVTQGPTTWAVVKSVTTVPVVYVFSADPVEAGFARSFARPQGNSTGLTLMSIELNGKRLELARELLPALRRTAILANPDHRGEHLERDNSEEAARRLGITIQYLPVHNDAELDASFPALVAGEPEAIVVFPDPVTIRNRQRIIDFAGTRHIPVISGWAIFAQSGALCTYGPRLTESYKRAAYYVDRILKGEKPADLPIERPSLFELVVNLKTAKMLGLTVPPSIFARADEVIE